MAATLFDREIAADRCRQWGLLGGIVPREYQVEDVEQSFRLWDGGQRGVLTRLGTGAGKTLSSCVKMKRWLDRGPNYRCGVLSYEQTLVYQFSEEVESFLGITPGIEMGELEIDPQFIPQIVVASRQSLMPHELCTREQRDEFTAYGIADIGMLPKVAGTRLLRQLQSTDTHVAVDGKAIWNHRPSIDAVVQVAAQIAELNQSYKCNPDLRPNGAPWGYSRLWKFDWRYNWLWVLDEAHKYALKHVTTGTFVDWFEQNPTSRRSGVTGTPKRSDNVSIGTKLFPGIAIDWPIGRLVKEGYAVPYVQKFIVVEGVDFARLNEECKGQQEKLDEAFSEALNTEEQLAKVVEPMLEMCGDRKTLIFSGTVAMAKSVAAYINARSLCECSCGTKRWVGNTIIGDGAKCRDCGEWLTNANVVRGGIHAYSLDGNVPHQARKETYKQYGNDKFQFLSVCGLCKEGFNSPGISCVAIFRPVSKKAQSLSEQMKGRGCRVLGGVIDGIDTAAARREVIAKSSKPNCLIIDLVGVSGNECFASTVEIYAEGLPDSVVARAEEIALTGGVPDPFQAIEQAQREAADREQAKKDREAREQAEREEAEQRARLDARVKYSTHDYGATDGSQPRDPKMATWPQLKFLRFCGMEFDKGWEPSKKQAGRMLDLLNKGTALSEVAYQCGLSSDQWSPSRPSVKMIKYMQRLGIRGCQSMTPKQASEAIERATHPEKFPDNPGLVDVAKGAIANAKTPEDLDAAGRRLRNSQSEFSAKDWAIVVQAGKDQRTKLTAPPEF